MATRASAGGQQGARGVHSVLAVFWEIVLGITGALALAGGVVAGAAFAVGCVSVGCACTWRSWRRRSRRDRQD